MVEWRLAALSKSTVTAYNYSEVSSLLALKDRRLCSVWLRDDRTSHPNLCMHKKLNWTESDCLVEKRLKRQMELAYKKPQTQVEGTVKEEFERETDSIIFLILNWGLMQEYTCYCTRVYTA